MGLTLVKSGVNRKDFSLHTSSTKLCHLAVIISKSKSYLIPKSDSLIGEIKASAFAGGLELIIFFSGMFFLDEYDISFFCVALKPVVMFFVSIFPDSKPEMISDSVADFSNPTRLVSAIS